MEVATKKTPLEKEISRRRTFGIISHPDAGKTTLTEKMLLMGGAIHEAGEVRANKSRRHATSDWMEMEKERGISVTSSVMQFEYEGCKINLLDTPGHKDFSEDTYRVLTAVDSVIMVLDHAAGVEPQTEKLMDVCRMRNTPIITFINKLDRDGLPPLDLLSDIEETLGIQAVPFNWPLGMGRLFRGLYNFQDQTIQRYQKGAGPQNTVLETDDVEDRIEALMGSGAEDLLFEIDLLSEAGANFSKADYLAGKQTPVFFGTALNNFGIKQMLDTFVTIAPPPQPRQTTTRTVQPQEDDFTGLVFKIQANMDPRHRDRIAFVRVCSGEFTRGMTVRHHRMEQDLRINNATMFMAQEREGVTSAFPGDIIGVHNHGTIRIGDSFSMDEPLWFTGVPSFAPERFRKVQLNDPLRAKHLAKGLKQLSEEGAIQVYRPIRGSAFILGAVGELQFDVTVDRLKNEYNVDAQLVGVNIAAARWVEADDPSVMQAFERRFQNDLYHDGAGDLAFLTYSSWYLNRTMEEWDTVRFKATKEHVPDVVAQE